MGRRREYHAPVVSIISWAALRLSQAQTGPRCLADDQARLVPEFRVRSSGDEFHGLDSVYRNLRRKRFALLIADRLAVDRKRCLRVIAQRMKETIGICIDAG